MTNEISREQVLEAHQRMFELIKGQFATMKRDEEIASVIIGLAPLPKETMTDMGLAPAVVMPFPLDNTTKHAVPFIMGRMAAKFGAAVHVCESWMLIADAKKGIDAEEALGGRPVSEHPDRTEAVTMIFIGEGWRAFVAHPIAAAGEHRTLLDATLQFEDEQNHFEGTLIGDAGRKVVN